jgi:hypothetical protein
MTGSDGDLASFVGTWTAAPGAPSSNHTFTWELHGGGLLGHWIIEAAESPDARAPVLAGRPMRIEMHIGEPWLEEGVLLFRVNDGPFVTEFRLVGEHEAVVGAAVHKHPELSGPEFARSIEGHRVRLARQSAA